MKCNDLLTLIGDDDPLLKFLGPDERYILSEIVKLLNNGTDEPWSESSAVRLFGSITPIFNYEGSLSKPCSDASWTYLIALASLMSNPDPKESEWALWTAQCKFFILLNIKKLNSFISETKFVKKLNNY